MGRQEAGQAPLFYAFNLKNHVPANHLLPASNSSRIWLSFTSNWPNLSHTGRPFVESTLLIRMLVVGLLRQLFELAAVSTSDFVSLDGIDDQVSRLRLGRVTKLTNATGQSI